MRGAREEEGRERTDPPERGLSMTAVREESPVAPCAGHTTGS